MHQSIATIDSPEFINLQPLDLNPLMSSCEIKVFYLGKNRNHSFITKEVATDMAKTLRGAPIVGYYKQEKEDFADHGERVILDDEGIKFECLTKPYGFVAPDAKVWFQKFEEIDDFGQTVTREYLMTTGYLWTGQFPECASAATAEGKPHSMELDEASMKGNWSEDSKTGIEFFIINDAIFSKLCILGDDVEPCFEGSSVSAPNVSKSFSLDKDFTTTLFTMFEELKSAIKGEQSMENENNVVLEGTENTAVPATDNTLAASDNVETTLDQVPAPEVTEFADQNNDDKEDKDGEKDKDEDKGEKKPEENHACGGGNDGDKEKEKKYALLEEQYNELNAKYTELETKFNALQEERDGLFSFKEKIEDAEKVKMIESFYMLSDEDKNEVFENRAKFTIDEIESKLSVICVRKQVKFNSDNNAEINNIQNKVVTYNLDNSTNNNVPAWISAVKNNQKR